MKKILKSFGYEFSPTNNGIKRWRKEIYNVNLMWVYSDGTFRYDPFRGLDKQFIAILEALTFVETRGGVHCLVETSKVKPELKKSWYMSMKKLSNLDQAGDQLLPVPGSIQGGFVPVFVNV